MLNFVWNTKEEEEEEEISLWESNIRLFEYSQKKKGVVARKRLENTDDSASKGEKDGQRTLGNLPLRIILQNV